MSGGRRSSDFEENALPPYWQPRGETPHLGPPKEEAIPAIPADPAPWAIKRASELSGLPKDFWKAGSPSPSVLAFARYIEAYEDAPLAEELVAARRWATNEFSDDGYANGLFDTAHAIVGFLAGAAWRQENTTNE